MKKIYLLIILLLIPLMGCSEDIEFIKDKIENLKLEDSAKCENFSIKFMDDDYSSSTSFYITPNGFEMDKLEEKGYSMQINVTYNVYYRKDYNVLWDVGYAGSPKYEISIVNEDGLGKFEYDLPTTKSPVSKSLTLTAQIADIKDQRWVLSFSTNNIQNIIYFSDILITYTCFK